MGWDGISTRRKMQPSHELIPDLGRVKGLEGIRAIGWQNGQDLAVTDNVGGPAVGSSSVIY